ncbi:MAG: aminopeptidase 1 [Gammaproteobacteria bacterium]|jgi:aspartyl aminopeptidase|nr:aminopeptidase 1 [Gammaproteobacteria bacterium]
MHKFRLFILIAAVSVLTTPLLAQEFSSAWLNVDQREQAQVMQFAEEFKDFMAVARSEMWFVREGVELAEAEGFRAWAPNTDASAMIPGSRWYAINRDRTLVLFIIGDTPITDGIRIVNTHIDSPRLEFKTIPFRNRNGVVTIDTQVHGGIKNYQWVNIPLGIIGRVDKVDGSTIWVEIGMDEDDPILLITDLAPHVDADYRSRTQRDVIATEELEPIIASLPVDNDSEFDLPSGRLLAILENQYGIQADDLLSADLQIIPVTRPRDVGLDRALVAAYGQDDRSTAYLSLRAIADVDVPAQTIFAYAVNNEETASWNTGVNSEWFNTLIAELINSTAGSFSDLDLRRTYAQSKVLVSDTTTALNPLFPSPQNPVLTSRLGYGLVVKEYGAGREANSEYFAYIRGVFDDADINWQTHSYDSGYGGGTIAAWFAGQNMDVIDVGIGIVSMHSPYEMSSKIDLWELYGGFKAFYQAD